MPDVDIDFFDRDGVLKLFKHTPASIIKDGEMGSITEKLRKTILNIQSETENNDFGWITPLDV